MIVVKFGGTSVGDADAIRRTAEIVRGRIDRDPIVVVSALGGATNALLAVAEQSGKGHLIGALRGVETLRDRHMRECEALLGTDDDAQEIAADLSAMFDELAHLAEALSTLGHVTPRSFDAIASQGEQLSCCSVFQESRNRRRVCRSAHCDDHGRAFHGGRAADGGNRGTLA